jgi:hypothetical protein
MKDLPDLAEWSKQMAEENREHQAERDAVTGTDMVFTIQPYEQQTLSKWRVEHLKTCRYYVNEDGTEVEFPGGTIGGCLSFKFTPTGIGVAITAQCACGEECNITDYDIW